MKRARPFVVVLIAALIATASVYGIADLRDLRATQLTLMVSGD
jgi:hypothetical protein